VRIVVRAARARPIAPFRLIEWGRLHHELDTALGSREDTVHRVLAASTTGHAVAASASVTNLF
jgi:hypothetical protein